jgi:hypothetical protein
MKEIRIIFSPEAEEVYNLLNSKAGASKSERMLLNAIHNKIDLIKSDIHYGNPVAKNLIPEEYRLRYGITNLFRIELPLFWRMLYTLTNNETEIEIIAFILDIINHEEYNRKFGYKRK